MKGVTNLTPEQLDEIRAQARRERFIDPAALALVRRGGFPSLWAEVVLGKPYRGPVNAEPWEIAALAAALTADPSPPDERRRRVREESLREAERREAERLARAAAELGAWHALRDRLPVPVTVGHNWTIGHWESGHVTGRDHIVVQGDLHVGRLHRNARDCLCETPAKRRQGARNKDPLRGVDRDDDGEDRIPTCKPCLKTAERIARPA